jgi:hypothetical protein
MIGLEGQQGVLLTTREGVQIVLLADATARAVIRQVLNGLDTAFSPPQGHGSRPRIKATDRVTTGHHP